MRIYFDAWVRALFSFSFDVDSEAWSKNGGLQNDQRSGSIFASLLDRKECSRDFSPWLGLYRVVNWKKSVTVFVFCFFQLLSRKVSGHGSVFQRGKETTGKGWCWIENRRMEKSRLKWRSNRCNWDSPFHFYRRKNNYYVFCFFRRFSKTDLHRLNHVRLHNGPYSVGQNGNIFWRRPLRVETKRKTRQTKYSPPDNLFLAPSATLTIRYLYSCSSALWIEEFSVFFVASWCC